MLIRIEPERLVNQIGENQDIGAHITDLMNRGLRGSLKTGNPVTGALYVDMDFYPKARRLPVSVNLAATRSFQR